MRTTARLSLLMIALSGLAFACGSAGLSSFGDSTPAVDGTADSGAAFQPPSATPSAGTNGLAPADNAVILVHAAKSAAFRLCFENEPDLRPQPDSQVMPEANVVGVEVGSAVRVRPLHGAPGQVFLFEEPLIRSLYPAFGGSDVGLSCRDLLAGQTKNFAINLGTVTANLAQGVHLLVVRGCPSDPILPTEHKYGVAECGADWTPAGNLHVTEITLAGTTRSGAGILPAQLVNLSQPLEAARAARDVVVTFGDLAQPTAQHASVVRNPALFGGAEPTPPAQLAYDSNDAAVYQSLGFRVSFAPAVGSADAAAETKVLEESLAQIQKQSSPRDVPPSYYTTASNYALLLLGDPAAQLPDGGPDTDDRRTLHLLAVPVVDPKDDAGAEAGVVDVDAAPTP